MTIESITLDMVSTSKLGPGQPAQPAQLEAGYGVSFTDMSHFDAAIRAVETRLETSPVEPTSPLLNATMRPFDALDAESASMADFARMLKESGKELTPSDMLMATMRVHEFSLHATLLSSCAHKLSDGAGQLFRQQS